MDKLNELLKSRKFWAAAVGLVVLFVGARAGVEQQQLTDAVLLIVSYILGTALESRAKA